jgi:hypothetical protein
MLLTVCIETGRTTLTHTSWTGLAPGSRKWMSGQAVALAALNDRRPFANSTASSSLRGPAPPSSRRPPSPLDFYLSWMSPGFGERLGPDGSVVPKKSPEAHIPIKKDTP